eukprot:3425263-Amphidinium_carterae.1
MPGQGLIHQASCREPDTCARHPTSLLIVRKQSLSSVIVKSPSIDGSLLQLSSFQTGCFAKN